jgi:hypothetical protein
MKKTFLIVALLLVPTTSFSLSEPLVPIKEEQKTEKKDDTGVIAGTIQTALIAGGCTYLTAVCFKLFKMGSLSHAQEALCALVSATTAIVGYPFARVYFGSSHEKASEVISGLACIPGAFLWNYFHAANEKILFEQFEQQQINGNKLLASYFRLMSSCVKKNLDKTFLMEGYDLGI